MLSIGSSPKTFNTLRHFAQSEKIVALLSTLSY
jgi:hypothetical protein